MVELDAEGAWIAARLAKAECDVDMRKGTRGV